MGICSSSVTCPQDDGCTYFSFFQGSTRLQVNCGTDFYGGDYKIGRTLTLETCMQACAREAQCIGLSYTNLNCYLKNTTTSAQNNTNTIGVTVISRGDPSPRPVDVACPETYTCPDNDGCIFRSDTRAFTLTCNGDYYGGDFNDTDTSSLQECAEICAHNERCVAAVFSGGAGPGHCYLKDRTADLSPNDLVDAVALYTRIEPDPAVVSSTVAEVVVTPTTPSLDMRA